jgi:hypothetical protein
MKKTIQNMPLKQQFMSLRPNKNNRVGATSMDRNNAIQAKRTGFNEYNTIIPSLKRPNI